MEHLTNIKKAMDNLGRNVDASDQQKPVPFKKFLEYLARDPQVNIRNIFQVFHDMIKSYVGEGVDEYPGDPESIGYVDYDSEKLLVEDTDHPFFADRLFANRLVNKVKTMRQGAQQNKIYIFKGPHGCGKSTFLNNLLCKFETYANTEAGARYEIIWRLNREALGALKDAKITRNYRKKNLEEDEVDAADAAEQEKNTPMPSFIRETGEYVEIPCPSHDNPILMIPKSQRRAFFDSLFKNDQFKWELFTEKEYEWVFRDNPCTICSSIYKALLEKLDNPAKVYAMLYAQKYYFNRRLGEGVSVFNPGDKPQRRNVVGNDMLQLRLDGLFKDSNRVRYIYSNYARTNNGIYALMDIKSHNTERLLELHNIISEGIHKVEHIEENVNSLFLALMNPEDKINIGGLLSFQDRVEYIEIPYVLDLRTEVKIYRDIFGKHIDANFLPKVLHNFARIIISSRLKEQSPALLEWIGSPDKYKGYCDKNLQLLKMEIYTGYIPTWLKEEDVKKFTSAIRKKVIAESEKEGDNGFSGRESIKLFNDFYTAYASEDRLITMSMLTTFFKKIDEEYTGHIPGGFLESLLHMYDYSILQEVKEALYYFNEEKISADIQDYLYAVNFEPGIEVTSIYTKEKLKIDEDFFETIELRLLGEKVNINTRLSFRQDTQKTYASHTLTREIMVEGKPVTGTELYANLRERYIFHLKEKALDPFLKNENFRRAIKDFDTETFKAYDTKIREDVTFLIDNLVKKYQYNKKGAREICMYVVDNDLARKFAK
ncbi:MAG: serine protein kinase PrkA [Candidatus Aminicenantes bacterium]|nr:serine protein kinase PrkA [Candidatus Aminicenantes bacterium]